MCGAGNNYLLVHLFSGLWVTGNWIQIWSEESFGSIIYRLPLLALALSAFANDLPTIQTMFSNEINVIKHIDACIHAAFLKREAFRGILMWFEHWPENCSSTSWGKWGLWYYSRYPALVSALEPSPGSYWTSPDLNVLIYKMGIKCFKSKMGCCALKRLDACGYLNWVGQAPHQFMSFPVAQNVALCDDRVIADVSYLCGVGPWSGITDVPIRKDTDVETKTIRRQKQRLEWGDSKPRGSATTRSWESHGRFYPQSQREHSHADTLISDSWPPKMRENKHFIQRSHFGIYHRGPVSPICLHLVSGDTWELESTGDDEVRPPGFQWPGWGKVTSLSIPLPLVPI